MKNVLHAIKHGIRGPSGEWRFRTRWVLFGAAALLGSFIVGLVVWVFLPIEEISPPRLLPSTAFCFFSLTIDQDSPGMSEILAGAGKRVESSDSWFGKKAAAKLVISSALPRSIVVILAADGSVPSGGSSPKGAAPEKGEIAAGESQEGESIVLIAGMGKAVRLMKLSARPLGRALFEGTQAVKRRIDGRRFWVAGQGREESRFSAFTFVGNNLVIGSSLPVLVDSYRSFAGGALPDTQRRLAALLFQALQQKDARLYADNGKGGLSDLFHTAEEKYAFAAFPSIDAVNTIEGSIRVLPDGMSGGAVFYCRGTEKLEDVKSDVKFIYGALRRKLRASDLDMKGEIAVEGKSVRFDFTIPGFAQALFARTPSEQGEKE